MQLLLQVLKTDLGSDTGKAPVKLDATIHAEPGANFAALVEFDTDVDGETLATLSVGLDREGAEDTPVLPLEVSQFRSIRAKPAVDATLFALPVTTEPAKPDVGRPVLPVAPQLPDRSTGVATTVILPQASDAPNRETIVPIARPVPVNQPVEFRPARPVIDLPIAASETPVRRRDAVETGLPRALEKVPDRALPVLQAVVQSAENRPASAPQKHTLPIAVEGAPPVDKAKLVEPSKLELTKPPVSNAGPETTQKTAPAAPKFWDLADNELRSRPGRVAPQPPVVSDPLRPGPEGQPRPSVDAVQVAPSGRETAPPPPRIERAQDRPARVEFRASRAAIQVQATPATQTIDVAQPVQVTYAPLAEQAQRDLRFSQREGTAIPGEGPLSLAPSDAPEARRTTEVALPRATETARPVVAQLVQAARAATDGMIEVKLWPEELGRVRLAMTPGDAGLVIQVTAERAETLELIRRNIDMFAGDLGREGFGDLSFSFGREGGAEDQTDEAGAETAGLAPTVEMATDAGVTRSLIAPDGRLDLRL